jgi:PAB1-binding protein PBP1
MIECAFGVAPAPLSVDPTGVTAGGLPAATIMDMAPMVNIPTFGMCSAPSNPEVAAATAAALGVLTPMPCVPVTVAPWAPGAVTVTIDGMPALTNDSICECAWGGVITIEEPGQFMVEAT